MADDKDEKGTGKGEPRLSDRGAAERQARLERQAAALRENLRRRKAQSRARQDGEGEGA